jgi:hypothetical protein
MASEADEFITLFIENYSRRAARPKGAEIAPLPHEVSSQAKPPAPSPEEGSR